MPNSILSAGKMRVVNIPSLGSYELVTGQGYSGGVYVKSPCAYACIDVRMTELAQIPWRLVEKTSPGGGTKAKVIEKHPVIDMLNSWGPGLSWSVAFGYTEADRCLSGAAFWLKESGGLSRLNPNTIEVMVTSTGVTGFKQRVFMPGGDVDEKTFRRDEVIYFREFHPTDDLGKGIAKMEIAKNAILAEYEAQRYVRAFFENDAIPGLLLHTEQDVPQSNLDALKAWWKVNFQGAKNKHKVAFVDKGLEAQILSTDLRAMALAEVRDEARRDICAIFGVDPILVGSMGKGSFSNTHEARMSLIQEVILPRIDEYFDVINVELVDPMDEGVKLEPATDKIPILQEDQDKLATRLAMLLDKKVITVEFMREELGIPEDAGPSTEEIRAEADKQFEAEAQARKPEDMAKWQKKAMKALRAGKSANVSFDTDFIPATLQGAIRARLEQARTAGDVEIAFHA